MADAPIAKTLEISCPTRSVTVTFPKNKNKPEEGNITRQVPVPCTRGQCAWWILAKQKCALVVIAEGMIQK